MEQEETVLKILNDRLVLSEVRLKSGSFNTVPADGGLFASIDNVIETLSKTGIDMKTNYKETTAGGQAVNVVEC